VRDADNAITGLFCEGYDLTERHEAAHALYALQSEMIYHSRVNTMGTMATMLAHELNQPLSAIANYSAGILRLLDPTVPEAQSVIDAVEAIREASWRAAEIIRNLNEMTKRRKTAQVVFNLKAAVSECTRMVRATVSPSIGIVEDIPEALMLEADRVQIQQVIINLLRNACDAVAVADRQMVSVTAQVEGEKIVVCVGDTGPGVSVEAAQAIFSRIESPKIGGMGLGLSICRSILDAHLGRIWLDNSGSQGARFCFSLPRMPVPVVAG
jgi:two-component system sensor kinase FixL